MDRPSGGDRRGRGDRKGKRAAPHRERGMMYGRPCCTYCGSRDHLPIRCPEVRCVRCTQLGHIVANCPNQEQCHFCGEVGHGAKACPTRYSRRLAGGGSGGVSSAAASTSTSTSTVVSAVSTDVSVCASGAGQPARPTSVLAGPSRSYAEASAPSRKRSAPVDVTVPPASASFSEKMALLGNLVRCLEAESGDSAFEVRRAALEREEEEFEASVRRRRAEIRARREALDAEEQQSQVFRSALPVLLNLEPRDGESNQTSNVADVADVNAPVNTDNVSNVPVNTDNVSNVPVNTDNVSNVPANDVDMADDSASRSNVSSPGVVTKVQEDQWHLVSHGTHNVSGASSGEHPSDGISSGHGVPDVPTRNRFEFANLSLSDGQDRSNTTPTDTVSASSGHVHNVLDVGGDQVADPEIKKDAD